MGSNTTKPGHPRIWPKPDGRRMTESGENGLADDWKGCIIIGDQLRTSSGHSARQVSGVFVRDIGNDHAVPGQA